MSSNEFQENANALARKTEGKLRVAQWKNIISPSLSFKKLSDGCLIVAGALLSLTLPNLKDLLEVINLYPMKVALALILASGICGLISRGMHESIQSEIKEKSELGNEIINICNGHKTEFDKLKTNAQNQNQEINDTLDWGALFAPLKTTYPNVMKAVAKELVAHDDDPEKKWKDAKNKANRYSSIVFLQSYILAVAIIIMLIFLK